MFVKFGLLYGKRVFGGWIDMYKKGEVGWKWFSIFYKLFNICMFRVGYDILISGLVWLLNCSIPIKCNTLE